jgi:hypothetical protein
MNVTLAVLVAAPSLDARRRTAPERTRRWTGTVGRLIMRRAVLFSLALNMRVIGPPPSIDGEIRNCR